MSVTWYAISPQDVICVGVENVIEGYIDNPKLIQNLMERAKKSYIKNDNIS